MDVYKNIIGVVASILKEYGFEKKANTFYLSNGHNWGMIGFQKSQSSSRNSLKFTMNIGVSSGALRQYIDHVDLNERPEIEAAHWEARIGFLMPGQPDFWWTMSKDGDIDALIFDIKRNLETIVIPAINEHITDCKLIEEWKNGTWAGTSLFKKYVYLTTLLKLGKNDDLNHFVEELLKISRKKPFEGDAIAHIRELDKIGN